MERFGLVEGHSLPLFNENEPDRSHQASKGGVMIPVESLALEEQDRESGKNGQGDDLLDNFELNEAESTAVVRESHSVGRNHKAVFNQGNSPGNQNYPDNRSV